MAVFTLHQFSPKRTKSRYFCGVNINSILGQTKIKGIIYNRLVLIRLDGITPLPTWHKTLLISKSLGVEK